MQPLPGSVRLSALFMLPHAAVFCMSEHTEPDSPTLRLSSRQPLVLMSIAWLAGCLQTVHRHAEWCLEQFWPHKMMIGPMLIAEPSRNTQHVNPSAHMRVLCQAGGTAEGPCYGWATAEYLTAEDAVKAAGLNGRQLQRRKIFIQLGTSLVDGMPHCSSHLAAIDNTSTSAAACHTCIRHN